MFSGVWQPTLKKQTKQWLPTSQKQTTTTMESDTFTMENVKAFELGESVKNDEATSEEPWPRLLMSLASLSPALLLTLLGELPRGNRKTLSLLRKKPQSLSKPLRVSQGLLRILSP